MNDEEWSNELVVSRQSQVGKIDKANKSQDIANISTDEARNRISQAVTDFEQLKPTPPEWYSEVSIPRSPLSDKSGFVLTCGAFITLGMFGTATAFLPLAGSLSVLALSTTLASFASLAYWYRGKHSSKKQPFIGQLSKIFLSRKQRELVDRKSLDLKQYNQAKDMYRLMVEARRKEFEQAGVFEAMRSYDQITGEHRELVLYGDGSFEYEEAEIEQTTKRSVTNRELTFEIASHIEESLAKIKNQS